MFVVYKAAQKDPSNSINFSGNNSFSIGFAEKRNSER